MHGRSFIAVIAAGGLALVFALLVPATVVAEDVATAEQPAAPTPAANALPSAAAPSTTTVPAPSAPNPASPTPPGAAAEPAATADPILASVRSKLGDANLRKGADPTDLAALDAFYANRSGPPVWVTPMGFSAKAQEVIDEIGKADEWGLSASAFQLPPAGALTDSPDGAGSRRDQAATRHPQICALRPRRPREPGKLKQDPRPGASHP